MIDLLKNVKTFIPNKMSWQNIVLGLVDTVTLKYREEVTSLKNYVGALTGLAGLGHAMAQFNGYYCLLYIYNILKETINNKAGYKPFLHVKMTSTYQAREIKQSFSSLQIVPNIDVDKINIIPVRIETPQYKETNNEILNYHKKLYGNTKIFQLLPNTEQQEEMNTDKLKEIRIEFLKAIFQIENSTSGPEGNPDCEENQNGRAFQEQQESLPLYTTVVVGELFSAITEFLEGMHGQGGGYKRKHKLTIKNKLKNKNKTRKH